MNFDQERYDDNQKLKIWSLWPRRFTAHWYLIRKKSRQRP